MLELKNINKTFNKGTVNEFTLFDDFNLKVRDGDFIALVGSNGSGKTSLLNIISGALKVDGGEVLMDGVSLTGKKEHQRYEKMGRVFQDPKEGTSSNMTLLENLALADNKGKSWNLKPALDKKRINYYKSGLSELHMGLEDKLNTRMDMLSGGQRQAVSLYMASMADICYLLLDEHTASLDPKSQEGVMKITDQVIREKKLTSLMVTHNLKYAIEYGTRLIMMHEGRVILDLEGQEKERANVDQILSLFNKISLEKGNSL